MRRLIAFPCDGETLVGTLDEANGTTGLLIVSGGNEVRAGAHRGMARLAARLSAEGVPVFRFDRRGVGDSSGENRGYASGGPDLRAAAARFRAEAPRIEQVVALGNCDAATALALFAEDAGVAAVILTNPWLQDRDADGLPPAPAIRARYLARLRNPRSWTRAPDFHRLFKGLSAMVKSRREPGASAAFAAMRLPRTVILAEGDATAQLYRATIGEKFVTIPTASHSFADAPDALETAVLEALRRYSAA